MCLWDMTDRYRDTKLSVIMRLRQIGAPCFKMSLYHAHGNRRIKWTISQFREFDNLTSQAAFIVHGEEKLKLDVCQVKDEN